MKGKLDRVAVARASAAAGVRSAALPFAYAYGSTTAVVGWVVRWAFYLCFGGAVISGVLQVLLLFVRPGFHQLGVVAGHLVAVAALGAVVGAAKSITQQLAPAGGVRVAKVGPIDSRDEIIDVQARDVRAS